MTNIKFEIGTTKEHPITCIKTERQTRHTGPSSPKKLWKKAFTMLEVGDYLKQSTLWNIKTSLELYYGPQYKVLYFF